ncbi:MAG: hypothetical protein GY825_12535, partial [Phycisphaeraceae bacterium]|nr:hypothetical protein [Phycisphaeraceae bacterium]
MQVLELAIEGRGFAVPTTHVEEVVPMVETRSLPESPPWLIGIFDHRGALTPLLDLHLLVGADPARSLVGSRIMVVRMTTGESRDPDGARRTVGLRAESVEEVVDVEPGGEEDFPGLQTESHAYLGRV